MQSFLWVERHANGEELEEWGEDEEGLVEDDIFKGNGGGGGLLLSSRLVGTLVF